MRQNFDPSSVEEAMRMAQTPAGQQFLRALKQSEPGKLNQLMADAAKGDYSGMQKSFMKLMRNPELQELLRKMQENTNG